MEPRDNSGFNCLCCHYELQNSVESLCPSCSFLERIDCKLFVANNGMIWEGKQRRTIRGWLKLDIGELEEQIKQPPPGPHLAPSAKGTYETTHIHRSRASSDSLSSHASLPNLLAISRTYGTGCILVRGMVCIGRDGQR
jgi:hypothetical protein